MSLTREEAYTALGLPYGAPDAEIKSAYKKFALEWHSDKNHHSSDTATIRFQQATGAYQLLAAEKTEAHMSLEDILDLLNMMFFGAMGGFPFHRRRFVFFNGDRDKFYISDDGNMGDLLNPSGGFHEPSAYPCQSSREPSHGTQAASCSSSSNSNSSNSSSSSSSSSSSNSSNSSSSTSTAHTGRAEPVEEPEWDVGSDFFATVASKGQPKHTKVDKTVKSTAKPVPVIKEEKPTKATARVVPQQPSPNALARRSVKIAMQGNQLARTQNYAEAIDKFTEAIRLHPREHRFYGNRSFCLEHLGFYTDALFDAETAIYLKPTWPRGYFRQARACIGLKQYGEAESALCQLISLNVSTEAAKQELRKVRTLLLVEMGFPQEQSEAAILEYDTVYAASEALLRQTGTLSTSGVGNMGIQNHKPPSPQPTVDFVAQRSQDSHGALGNSPVPPPPSHKHVSLWLGNITSAVTEEMLQELFRPFGQITSIRMLVDRKCAFVNYTSEEAAESALWSLQGCQVADTNLLIHFQSGSAKRIAAAFQQPSAGPPEHDEFTSLSS